ncbi:hypothetical protein BDZ94DRAFT_1264381, partial [Collybia nuda]
MLSDDAQSVKEGWETGHKDKDSIKRENSPQVPDAALPDDEQSASDDGYHVDYDDDESEDPNTPADFFSDVEKGLGKCTMDTMFYPVDQSSDEYDINYETSSTLKASGVTPQISTRSIKGSMNTYGPPS